jgi:hypothetical protein
MNLVFFMKKLVCSFDDRKSILLKVSLVVTLIFLSTNSRYAYTFSITLLAVSLGHIKVLGAVSMMRVMSKMC